MIRRLLLKIRKWGSLSLVITLVMLIFMLSLVMSSGFGLFEPVDCSTLENALNSISELLGAIATVIGVSIIISLFAVVFYYIYYLLRKAAAKTQSTFLIILCIIAQIICLPALCGTEFSPEDLFYYGCILLDIITIFLPKEECE